MSRNNWWIPLGALVIAAGYLPTVNTRFDFIDDGNLVYPAPAGTTAGGHVELWWAKVYANYDHLGPFRPTLWVHWEVMANLAGGDAVAWRLMRLAFCALSAGMLLWLLRELKIHPAAALMTTAAAMWNPYRNEIWTSLTLSEGVAMPYALLALVAARKAASADRPWKWDIAAAFGVLVALGCKNVFVALIPAMVVLRLFPDGVRLRDGLRRNWLRAGLFTLTLSLPVAHYVYFQQHWHPGQYQTHGPSLAQLGRMLSGLKGAMSADFLGVTYLVIGALLVLHRSAGLLARRASEGGTEIHPRSRVGLTETHRAALLLAATLTTAGVIVYLPLDMMSGRYTMPAVWGLDVLLGVALTAFVSLPSSRGKTVGWIALAVGIAVVAVVNAGRQEKFAARARMLWQAVESIEHTAPTGTTIDWVSGDSAAGELNVEEGIHFRWHLLHRGRPDIAVRLVDAAGDPVSRVELPVAANPPTFRMVGHGGGAVGWETKQTFDAGYRLGRKRFACVLESRTGKQSAER